MQEIKQKKSPIKQNISLYLAKKGISDYEYYKISGTTRGILAQNNGISEDNIARFLAYAKDVNIEWLLTGRGDMLKTKCTLNETPSPEETIPEDKVTKNKQKKQIDSIQKISDGARDGIPLIPIDAMAGALMGEQTVLEYECERYIVPAFQNADFLIRTKGDSMQPTYNSGDLVACRRVSMSGLFFQWGRVYVIDTNQGVLIKRINPGVDTDHVSIVSDNDRYQPFQLPVSDIYAVALVVGTIRLE